MAYKNWVHFTEKIFIYEHFFELPLPKYTFDVYNISGLKKNTNFLLKAQILLLVKCIFNNAPFYY